MENFIFFPLLAETAAGQIHFADRFPEGRHNECFTSVSACGGYRCGHTGRAGQAQEDKAAGDQKDDRRKGENIRKGPVSGDQAGESSAKSNAGETSSKTKVLAFVKEHMGNLAAAHA